MGGTASYETTEIEIPPLVSTAVDAAVDRGFQLCCRPEIGRLIAVLAAGVPRGGRIGETGTGTGAGVAWMLSNCQPDVEIVSVEIDPGRTKCARTILADYPNVRVENTSSARIGEYGPFDLLILDGGPGSGKGDHPAAEPSKLLVPGGTLTVDDFPPMTQWPPMFEGELDTARLLWLTHAELHTTEIRVAEDLAVLVGRRIHPIG